MGCWAFPESPRYLTKVGRGDEARYILGRLRGETGDDEGRAEAEYQDICGIVDLEKDSSQAQSYWKMLFGVDSGKLHTGRRVQLVIWLQIMQEWIGKLSFSIHCPELTCRLRYCWCYTLLTYNFQTCWYSKRKRAMDSGYQYDHIHVLHIDLCVYS